METERKTWKTILRVTLTAATTIALLVVVLAASQHQESLFLNPEAVIRINDEDEFSFLQKKDIQDWLIDSRQIELARTKIADLDLKRIEVIAESNPWVASAEVYVDSRRNLTIELKQRTPVVRVFSQNGQSFYMDSTCNQMPLSSGYAYPAVVFTGVPVLSSDSAQLRLMSKIVALGKQIAADTFWNAQITQIEVLPDETFVAATLIGDQKILLGDTTRLDEKLANLFAFYQTVPAKLGWNAYQTLDLRFKGQIVASPTIQPATATRPAERGPVEETTVPDTQVQPRPSASARFEAKEEAAASPPRQKERTAEKANTGQKPKYIFNRPKS